MTLKPEDLQRIQKDTCQQAVEDVEKAVRESMAVGWITFSIGPPAARKATYKAWTLPGDEALVLTSDYLPLMKAGILPPLECVGLMAQAQALGMPYEPTFFWAQLLQLPEFVFIHFASDYRSLMKQEIQQAIEAVG